jgi:hypothetical protein
MSARASTFDRALREVAAPVLLAHGFEFDGSRTFRRLSGETCQIINFQLGQRSMAGKFTVNLGFFSDGDRPGVSAARANDYDCLTEHRARIGALIPVRFPRMAKLPYVGFLFGIPDKWWPFSSDSSLTYISVSTAVDKIVAHGLGWLKVSGP